MILVKNKNTRAAYNLAFEECLLKNNGINQSIVCFWQNEKAIIIGRNQDYYREINNVFVEHNNIEVIRRLSGGGAVFHDLGNINFTIITNIDSDYSYEKFLKPIIDFLNSKKIPAVFSGRNDIEVAGKKISGNAQYIYKKRIMHHGTLLFDVDIKMLSLCLNPDKSKTSMKGISSIRARVTNIKPLLKTQISVDEFISQLEEYFIKIGFKYKDLSNSFQERVINLMNRKYLTKEWNINAGPSWKTAQITNTISKRFKGGLLSISAQVIGGRIQTINFSGDFLSRKNLGNLEMELQGASKIDLKEILNDMKVSDYFGAIKKEEVVTLINKLYD